MSPRLSAVLLLLIALALGAGFFLFYGGARTTTQVDLPPGNSPVPAPALNTPRVPSNSPIKPVESAQNTASSNLAASEPSAKSEPQKPLLPYLLGSPENLPTMEPATVLDNMRIVLRNYGSRFGGNPVGTNPEIAAALNGDNPKQVRFINPDSGLRINGRGELVDWWGTPFFFHQLSASETEIHSAGPDKQMWTADDLVIR